jgi:hypothetical protein
MLDHVETIMPAHNPRGRALTRALKAANRHIAPLPVRIEHVSSSVKRRRMVHDTMPPAAGERPRSHYGNLLLCAA